MEVKILNLVFVEIAAKFFGKQREYTLNDKRIVIVMQCSKRVKSTLWLARSPALAPRKEASTLFYFLALSQAPGFRERRALFYFQRLLRSN